LLINVTQPFYDLFVTFSLKKKSINLLLYCHPLGRGLTYGADRYVAVHGLTCGADRYCIISVRQVFVFEQFYCGLF
jgi:hypothetical protein